MVRDSIAVVVPIEWMILVGAEVDDRGGDGSTSVGTIDETQFSRAVIGLVVGAGA